MSCPITSHFKGDILLFTAKKLYSNLKLQLQLCWHCLPAFLFMASMGIFHAGNCSDKIEIYSHSFDVNEGASEDISFWMTI